jgi:hypothetical protein
MPNVENLDDDIADESNNYASKFLSYDDKEEDSMFMAKKKSTSNRRYSVGRMSVTKKLKEKQEASRIERTMP